MTTELKKEVFRLLKEDVEFRYAIAGLIGLDEVLKRLDGHEEELVKLRGDMNSGFERHDRELTRLREDMNNGFARHDQELAKLREDMTQGFERHDREIAQLRQEMKEGFERHDRELAQLRKDMNEGFERHDRELVQLRGDMNRGFDLLERHVSALGARWGLMSEEAFREGLKGLLEKELDLKVERWEDYDSEGLVFGYPSEVEVDVALRDDRIVLIELTSHATASSVYAFKRKSIFYEKRTGKKPSRLLMITPYAEDKALEASKELQVELYTKV